MSDFDTVVKTFADSDAAFVAARTARLEAAYAVLDSLRERLDVPSVVARTSIGFAKLSNGLYAVLVPTQAKVSSTPQNSFDISEFLLYLNLEEDEEDDEDVFVDTQHLDEAAACLIALLDEKMYHKPGNVTYDRLAIALAAAYASDRR